MTSASRGPAHERRRHWWTLIGGTVVFVVVGLVLWPGLVRQERSSAPEPTATGARPEPPERAGGPRAGAPRRHSAAALAPDAPGAVQDTPAFDCIIVPNAVIEIRSPITGLIDTIPVERSDYVETGQVLARLESSVERAAVRVAQSRAERTVEVEAGRVALGLGAKRYSRALELFKTDSLSLDAREEVETEAKLASLELELAQENHRLASLQLDQAVAALERRTIRSPVSGFVVERLMEPGEVVDEETILRLAQVDPLRVEVILPSHWFGRVEPGDPAEIVPEPPLDQALSAEVAVVDRVIDGASGTFGVRLLLPNPDHALPAGLRCQVRFLENSSDPSHSDVDD